MALQDRHCGPCRRGDPPLSDARARQLHGELPKWTLEDKALVRDVEFKDFQAAVAFVDRVAEVAEAEGHHPDLRLHDYRHVEVLLTTHAVGGLSENDFILAARIDRLIQESQPLVPGHTSGT